MSLVYSLCCGNEKKVQNNVLCFGTFEMENVFELFKFPANVVEIRVTMISHINFD